MSDRDKHERRLVAALKALLSEYGDIAARNPGRIPWERFERELTAALIPELLTTYIESASNLAGKVRFDLNNERAAIQAQRWSERYAATLAGEVVGNTRKRLEKAKEQKDAGELAAILLLLFGDDRAWNIGITETTRSITAGEKATVYQFEREMQKAQGRQELSDEQRRKAGLPRREEIAELIPVWVTEADARVCFPAGTMVHVESGQVPIERLKPKDLVWTRRGLRPVIATSRRPYSGRMSTVCHREGALTATEDHPIWHSEKGWISAGDFNLGDALNAFGNQNIEVSGVRNFLVGQSQNPVPLSVQCDGFPFISGGVLMPVDAIDFDGDHQEWQEEIDAVSSNGGLLFKLDRQFRESQSDKFLWNGFPVELPVARKLAELPVMVSRFLPKFFATVSALDVVRWPAAFFRAVVSATCQGLFGTEFVSAPLAVDVHGGCSFAGIATHSVPLGNAFVDRELFLAGRTSFRHPWTVLSSALNRTANISARFGTRGSQVERVSADRTGLVHTSPFSFLRSFLEFFEWQRHVGLYHDRLSNSIEVYDIQVAGEPEFYANGVLVHNCPICQPLHRKRPEFWQRFVPGGPPAHVRCRCELHWERNILVGAA